MKKMKKKPKKMSIQRICAEIEKHKTDADLYDVKDLVDAIDELRFEWVRRRATEEVVGSIESLILDVNPHGHWDNDSLEGKVLHRAVKHVEKKILQELRQEVWGWK